ncbi:MAG: hypothetical protein BJ554DRAFT_5733 [Olpidium bornovanus]|uniref:Metaxin n=1 Tax=Olpidium bornovanus TaxID=278681 RepID=A0A8H7ZZ27_9FUNG|nr:MAG: hypothetical protein BJ554DRAFT_5733 [Olpidium bornovanus]
MLLSDGGAQPEFCAIGRYAALLNNKVHDALLYAWYAEPENYVGAVRPTYASLLPFSMRSLEPTRMRDRARARLALLGVSFEDEGGLDVDRKPTSPFWHSPVENPDAKSGKTKSILEEVESQLAIALVANSTAILRPTTLDVIAYGFLRLQVHPRLPRPDLSNQLSRRHKNLCDFCERMRERIDMLGARPISPPVVEAWSTSLSLASLARFPGLLVRSLLPSSCVPHAFTFRRQAQAKRKKTPAEVGFERQRLISIAGGLAAVVAYVIANGMVRVKFGGLDSEEDEEDEEDDDGEEGWQEDFGELGGGYDEYDD